MHPRSGISACEDRVINYASPSAIHTLPRLNDGTWEFPVLHVRGGTSTGLIIWDRIAPKDLELREELLRHLMGLPLHGATSDTKSWKPSGLRPVTARYRLSLAGANTLIEGLAFTGKNAAVDRS